MNRGQQLSIMILDYILAILLSLNIIAILLMVKTYQSYWKSKTCQGINILTNLGTFTFYSLASAVLTAIGLSIWKLVVGHVNLVVGCVGLEIMYFFCKLSFLLMTCLISVKIGLRTQFDRIHNEDPEELGNKLLTGCLTLAATHSAAVGVYQGWTGAIVHPAIKYWAQTDIPQSGINFSNLTCIGILALNMGLKAAKQIQKHHMKRVGNTSIQVGEQLTTKKNGEYSIKHVAKGGTLLTILFVIVLAKNLILESVEVTEQVRVAQDSVLALLGFPCLAYTALTKGFLNYLKRWYKQEAEARRLNVSKGRSQLWRSNRVAP